MKELERFENYQQVSDHIESRSIGTTAENFDVPADAHWVMISTTAAAANPAYLQFLEETQEELITNGDFAADSDWTKGTGWTIAGGIATATGAINTNLSQTLSNLQVGRSYKVTFTATRSAGSVRPVLGGTNGTDRSTSSTFTETIVAGSTDLDLVFDTTSFTGTIDDVSVVAISVIPATDDTSGYAPIGICVGMEPYIVGINGITQISAVSGATAVLTLAYYG
jgi:hypothetical protein